MSAKDGVYFSPNAEEFRTEASDGTLMPARRWRAQGERRGTIVYVHGLSGAATDFDPVADRLAAKGWEGFGLYLRGQGNDPVMERRGYWMSAEGHLDDLEKFTRELPDCRGPLFYYGESMGAVIVSLAAVHQRLMPADGIILSAPVVALRNPPPWWIQKMIIWLARIAPRLRVELGPLISRSKSGKRALLTRDEAYQKWLDEKPDRLRRFSLGMLRNLNLMMEEAYRRAPEIQLPVFMQHAGHDLFIAPVQSAEFFHRIGSKEKKAQFYPEAYHLLFRDLDANQVIEDVAAWIMERTSA